MGMSGYHSAAEPRWWMGVDGGPEPLRLILSDHLGVTPTIG